MGLGKSLKNKNRNTTITTKSKSLEESRFAPGDFPILDIATAEANLAIMNLSSVFAGKVERNPSINGNTKKKKTRTERHTELKMLQESFI